MQLTGSGSLSYPVDTDILTTTLTLTCALWDELFGMRMLPPKAGSAKKVAKWLKDCTDAGYRMKRRCHFHFLTRISILLSFSLITTLCS